MGGLGSRSYSSSGRKQKRAVEVVGTGKPAMPKGLTPDVKAAFASVAKLTSGLTFSQDSRTILEAAELIARQDKFLAALQQTPLDEKLNRTSLAIGRQLNMLLGKLGLNPRDRQSMLAPVTEAEPEDRIEQMLAARQRRENGSSLSPRSRVPNRHQDLKDKQRFFK